MQEKSKESYDRLTLKVLNTRKFFPIGSTVKIELLEGTTYKFWVFGKQTRQFVRFSIEEEESDTMYMASPEDTNALFENLCIWKRGIGAITMVPDNVPKAAAIEACTYIRDKFVALYDRLIEREIEYYANGIQASYDAAQKRRQARLDETKSSLTEEQAKESTKEQEEAARKEVDEKAKEYAKREEIKDFLTEKAEEIINEERQKHIEEELKKYETKKVVMSETDRLKKYLMHLETVLLPFWLKSEDKDIIALARQVETQLKLARKLKQDDHKTFQSIAESIDEATNRIFCIEAERGYEGGLNPPGTEEKYAEKVEKKQSLLDKITDIDYPKDEDKKSD